LSSKAKEISVKYKVDPRGFISDEAFLFQLVRFNYTPPYPTLSVGPLIKEVTEGVKIYVNYLIYPIHKYVPKFSFLRIESFTRDAVEGISSLKFTLDGIPIVLALADKTAKELSSGILRYIAFSLERMGLQESFRGKFEVLNVV
jgi:NurA domain.